MRHIYYILITGIIMCGLACTKDKDYNFEINGTITDGASGKTIYLVQVVDNAQEIIDSTVVDRQGSYRLVGFTRQPDFFYVRFTDRKSLVQLIISPGEKITLNGDYKNLPLNYTVTGSDESELIYEMNQRIKNEVAKLKESQKVMLDHKGKDDYEKYKLAFDSIFTKTRIDLKDYVISIVEDNKNSLVSMVALSLQLESRETILDPFNDFEFFDLVDSTLSQNYPDVKEVQNMQNYIGRIREEINIREKAKKLTAIGATAPEIELENPDGEKVPLSSLRGKYVLVDFWAAWCKPCRQENPNLVKAYQKFHKKGFEIYQVSLDKYKQAWLKAIKDDNLDWVHVSDLKHWQSAAAKLYNVRSIPANFLLDPKGKIIAKNLRGKALELKLGQYLF